MGSRTGKKRDKAGAFDKLAVAIITAEQHKRGGYVECDVANHSDAEQRRTMRSGETRTIRKQTRVERLYRAGTIEQRHLAACEWYAAAHEVGYSTIGCTADYSRAGGGSFGSSDLLARYKAQAEARADYKFGRAAIPSVLLPLFERVVIHNDELGDAFAGEFEASGKRMQQSRRAAAFRLAADRLLLGIAHLLPS